MKRRGISILVLVVAAVFGSLQMNAQIQLTTETYDLLSLHWSMPTYLDPAATGDTDYIRIRAGARMELLGSHDSPKNYLAVADSPFKIGSKRIGAGIVANSLSYDLFRNFSIGAQGSYKFNFKKSVLSVGIQLGYYHTKFKGSELVITNNSGEDLPDNEKPGESENPDTDIPDPENPDYDENDIPTQDIGGGAFDVGIGIRFQHPKFYVAISGRHLTNPTIKLIREGEEASDTRYVETKLPATLYFDAGGNIAINNSLFTLQPSMLLATDFKDIKGVVEMRATYDRKFTFGVDYRYNSAAGVVAGLYLKNFFIGYSWEYDYKNHPRGSTGNHELVLGYQLKLDMGGKNTFSHRSIRIM